MVQGALDGTSCNVDEEFLDLFPRYVANRGRDVEAVAAALERGDFQLIRVIGHNMHGSGRTFGLDELSAIGAILERAAQEADRTGILRQLPRIGACLSRIDVAAACARAFAAGREGPAAAHTGCDDEAIDILLVDDQEINVAIIGRFLRREGYRVTSLESGEAALAALNVPPLPALILLDVVMNGPDGLETCSRIKSDPATRGIPVVLVSSDGSGQDRIRGWAAGADGFLSKPVDRVELVRQVRSLLPAARRAAAQPQADPR